MFYTKANGKNKHGFSFLMECIFTFTSESGQVLDSARAVKILN